MGPRDFVFSKGKKILDASKNLVMGREVKGIAERVCPNDIRKSLVTGYDVHPDIQSYKKDGSRRFPMWPITQLLYSKIVTIPSRLRKPWMLQNICTKKIAVLYGSC